MKPEACTGNYRREDWLWYHYGELPASKRAQQKAHLLECPACHSRLRELEELLASLPPDDSVPEPAEIRAFAARVTGRIRSRAGRFRAPGWSGALAGALLAVVLVWGVAPEPRPPASGSAVEIGAELEILEELELLQDLELLEQMELLAELQEAG